MSLVIAQRVRYIAKPIDKCYTIDNLSTIISTNFLRISLRNRFSNNILIMCYDNLFFILLQTIIIINAYDLSVIIVIGREVYFFKFIYFNVQT